MLCVGLGCSSSDDKNQENESSSSQSEEEIIQILSPNSLYTVDDIIAAGWKNPKNSHLKHCLMRLVYGMASIKSEMLKLGFTNPMIQL